MADGRLLLALSACGAPAAGPMPDGGTSRTSLPSANPSSPTAGTLQAAAAAALQPPPEGFESIAANDRLELLLDRERGGIAVRVRSNGALLYSTPPGAEQDGRASGLQKAILRSLLTLTYTDDKNNSFTVASLISSVNRDGYAATVDPDGSATLTFDFVREEIRIPVRFSLGPDYLSATILGDRIEEYGPNRLATVSLMPYFGAGGSETEGALLVPDGSGALIRFNNGKTAAREFGDMVYGSELAIQRPFLTYPSRQIHLPVFGILQGDATFLAVIHQSAAASSIRAFVSGKYTSYNNAFSEFIYRVTGSVRLPMKNWSQRTIQMLSGTAVSSPYEVRYYPVPDRPDYLGLADRYATYLAEEMGVSPSSALGESSAYLDLYCTVRRPKSILGIPTRVTEALSSFDGIRSLLGEMEGTSLDGATVRLLGWADGGLYGRFNTSARADRAPGGEAALKTLLVEAADRGVAIYPAADLTNVYEGGGGFNRFRDSAKNLTRIPALQYAYQLNLLIYDYDVRPWYLTAPDRYGRHFSRFLQNFRSRASAGSAGLAILGAGSLCYSDFAKGGILRDRAVGFYQDAFAQAEGTPLMFDKANAYAFPFASHLVDVPTDSSHYDITDEAVPFYQAALRTLLPMGSEPLNLAANPDRQFLRCLEYGVHPAFAWTTGDPADLKDTRLNGVFAPDARLWLDQATAWVQAYREAMAGTEGTPIVEHGQVAPSCFRTRYGNGTVIFVNYSDQDVRVGDRVVPALGYRKEAEG